MIRNSVLLLADVGVPMIFLTFPAMIVLLLPIIALETWLCRKWLFLGHVDSSQIECSG
jgi:hypothetical protein